MERQELVEEIVRRVNERLSAIGLAADAGERAAAKPGLLVLTQTHGTDCHRLLESEAVRAHYRTECALAKQYTVNLGDYEAVVLYQLSCGALAALASGVCTCAYTRLASRAILMGKRVYVPAEEVELYRYRNTAPAPYFEMLLRKLQLLTDAGVVVCARGELEQRLLAGGAPGKSAPVEAPIGPAPAETRMNKRVLTERDILAARQAGVSRIRVGRRCILTALAADAAAGCGLAVLRDGDTPES